jgi:threonine 3-dehydrogenase
MKAIRKTKRQEGAEILDISVPEIGEHDLLVKVKAAAMCKSDVDVFEWTPLVAAANYELPFTLGHEFAGEVVEAGKLVKNFKQGDRVAGETHIPCGYCKECRTGHMHICSNNMGVFGRNVDGAFAEYILLPEISAIKLAPSMDMKEAALLEPLGTALHALQKAQCQGKSILIMGTGTIGLMACELAKALGAIKVLALDINSERLEFSKKCGADITINGMKEDLVEVVKAETNGHGVQCVIDFTGNQRVINQAIDALCIAGQMVHVGMVEKELAIPSFMYRVVYRELKITGIFGRHMFNTWELLVDMLDAGKVGLDKYIGAEMSMWKYQTALDEFNNIIGRAILIP